MTADNADGDSAIRVYPRYLRFNSDFLYTRSELGLRRGHGMAPGSVFQQAARAPRADGQRRS